MAEVEPSEPEPSVAPVGSAEMVNALKDKHAQNSKTASRFPNVIQQNHDRDAETIAGKLANGYIGFEWQIETQSVEQKRN
jgi:hypothetical protein